MVISRSIHVAANGITSYFLWLSNIPLHICTTSLAYATATATWDLSWVCKLHCSSGQRQILNLLSKARDQTHILMDTSWVHNSLSHNGNSSMVFRYKSGLTLIPGHPKCHYDPPVKVGTYGGKMPPRILAKVHLTVGPSVCTPSCDTPPTPEYLIGMNKLSSW